MARALTLGNGRMLVCLDNFGFVRDLYYPYVGLENHVGGEKHRIGVWLNGTFSWIDDGTWKITIGYKPETMVGYLVCKHDGLQISLVMEDIVYNEETIFTRQVDVYNHSDKKIEVRLFFHQVFHISESIKRNTAFYDPTHNAIVHYKGQRVFVVNGLTVDGNGIDDYTVGAYQFEGKEGSYRDAEDGELSKNAVEHGSVDSAIRFCVSCDANSKTRMYYWIAAGTNLDEAYALNTLVMTKRPDAIMHSTESYWTAWLRTKQESIKDLPEHLKKLYDTSLLIMRCHTDNRGAIIASADSEMIQYGKDDYSYMWPRDAAFIVNILVKAGYPEVVKPFFTFCKDVLHKDGYMHHRFRPDKSLGSTWHSTTAQQEWLREKRLQLPIQEDESASVIWALWQYYEKSNDLEFIEELYKPLIEKIGNFLVGYRDPSTLLPLPSYDLWEEKIGISTYTCAAVYGGLMAAAKFSELLDKRTRMRAFKKAAKEIKEAAIKHLFSPSLQGFVRYAHLKDGAVEREEILDSSSLFGLWYFNMLDQDHPLFQKSLRAQMLRLHNPSPLGGMIRYERDAYFRRGQLAYPWIITTLWEAQRRLDLPDVSLDDISYCEQQLEWVWQHRYLSGILPEQFDPTSGESLSATPLVWSHAVYVETLLKYVQVSERLQQQTERQAKAIVQL